MILPAGTFSDADNYILMLFSVSRILEFVCFNVLCFFVLLSYMTSFLDGATWSFLVRRIYEISYPKNSGIVEKGRQVFDHSDTYSGFFTQL